MKKIIEFISNHYKAFYVFLNIIEIIFGFYFMSVLFLNGFTAEQLDEPSAFCGFIFFFIFSSVFHIFDALIF